MTYSMAPRTRRVVLARVAALVTGTSHYHTRPSIQRFSSATNGTLLRACAHFSRVESEKARLYVGSHRVDDDDEREMRLTPLILEQGELLETICGTRSVSVDECRAKARVYLLRDAGEAFHLATQYRVIEARLLLSLLSDLQALA